MQNYSFPINPCHLGICYAIPSAETLRQRPALVGGYTPMFAYIGREGCLADLELREGRQHSQKGTPEFLKETIGS